MNDIYISTVFIISLFLAAYLLRNRPVIVSKNRNLTLDAFRGLLAPMVLTHHFILTYNWKKTGVWEASDLFVGNLGSIPVSLFFMITGYLFVGKIVSGVSSWRILAINRLLRIYPLYILMLAGIFLVYFMSCKSSSGTQEILKTIAKGIIFFLRPINGFDISRVIAGVQWTLLYEAIFYISLPFISLFLCKPSNKKSMILAIISLIIVLFSVAILHVKYELFTLFIIGGVASFISKSKISNKIKKYGSHVAIASILVSFIYTESYSLLQMFTLGLLFISICCKSDMYGMLKSKGLIYLGDISYSIYLVHGFILYVAFTYLDILDFQKIGSIEFYSLFPVVIAVVILVSSLTYRYIETPFSGKAASLISLFKRN